MESNQKFNIRVYGLLIANNCVLVTDEFLWEKSVTKFPGGGLEWGEGIIDCLRREFKEELNIDIYNEKLFYLTDFFQLSLLDKNHQIISVYYLVSCNNYELIPVKLIAHDHVKQEHGSQIFRWLNLQALESKDFHFPIDKIVVEKVRKLYER